MKAAVELRQLPFIQGSIFFMGWTGFALLEKGLFVQISLMFMFLACLFDVPRLLKPENLTRLLSYRHLVTLFVFLLFVLLSIWNWDETLVFARKTQVAAGQRQLLSLAVALTFHFVFFLAIQSWEDIRRGLKVYALGGIFPCIYGTLEIINIFLDSRLSPFLGLLQSKNESYNESDLLGTGFSRITFMAPEASIGCVYAMTLVALFIATMMTGRTKSPVRVISKAMGLSAMGFAFCTLAKTIIFPIGAIVTTAFFYSRMKLHEKVGLRVVFAGLLAVAVGLLISVSALVIYRISSISTQTISEDISTWTRLHDFMVGVRMAWENPLTGVGWGSFTHEYARYVVDMFSIQFNRELMGHYVDLGRNMILSPYNLYLHVCAEAGFIAGFAFIFFLFFPVWRTIRFAAQHSQEARGYWALCAALGAGVVLSSGFSYVSFNIYYFWFFLAICQAIDSNPSLRARPHS